MYYPVASGGFACFFKDGVRVCFCRPKKQGNPPHTHTHRRRTRLIHELVPQLRRLSDLKFQTPQTKLSEEEVGRSALAQLGGFSPGRERVGSATSSACGGLTPPGASGL